MRHLLLIVLLSALSSIPAFGWGCEGHQIVALIARAHLTADVSAAVDELLSANPIDPALKRFCKDSPADPMADSSTWADDAKNSEKTAVWHYVDIPRSVNEVTSLDAWCPPIGPSVEGKNRPGCITDAIEYEAAILRDKSRPGSDRATALRYLIHFIADIHQPLHDEDNDDQGGNCTVIRFYTDAAPTNLHAIWDYKMIEHRLGDENLSPAAYAAELDERFSGKFTTTLSGADVDDPVAWAWETHAIGQSNTYGNLMPAIPTLAPNPQLSCATERDSVRDLHIVIDDTYFKQAMPVIDERLATAGFRLANFLNAVLR